MLVWQDLQPEPEMPSSCWKQEQFFLPHNKMNAIRIGLLVLFNYFQIHLLETGNKENDSRSFLIYLTRVHSIILFLLK